MQVAGTIDRIEIKCETEEEKAHAQAMINLSSKVRDRRDPLIYWGDSDAFNGALIVNTVGCDLTDEEWAAQCAEAAASAMEPTFSSSAAESEINPPK